MSSVSVQITADVSSLTAKLAVAKAEMSDANAELRKLAQQMAEAGSSASDELKSGLATAAAEAARTRAQISELNAELSKVSQGHFSALESGVKSALSPLTAMTSAISGMGEALVAAFAVDRIVAWDAKVAESGAHVLALSKQTGLSTEQISSLGVAAATAGMSVDQIAEMVDRLEKNMVAAQSGTGEQAKAFAALGISAKDLKGLSVDEVINRIADAFAAAPDGADKTTIAMDLMGRSGAAMIPVLDGGSAGLARMKQIAQETGTVISGDMAQGMSRTAEDFSTFGKSVEGLGISLFEVFKPGIDVTVEGLTKFVEEINDSIRQGGAMADVVKVVAAGFNLAVGAVTTASFAVHEWWNYTEAAFEGFGDLVHGNFTKALQDVEAGYAKMKADALDYAATIAKLATNSGSDLGDMSGSGGGKGSGLHAPGQGGGGDGEKDYFAQWKADLDTQLTQLQLFGQDAEGYELQYWQQKLATAQAGGQQYVSSAREVTSEVYSLESRANEESLTNAQKMREAQDKLLEDQIDAGAREVEQANQNIESDWRNFKAGIDEKREAAKGNYAEIIALDQQLVAEAKALYGVDTANYEDALKQMTADMRAEVQKQVQAQREGMDEILGLEKSLVSNIITGRQTMGQVLLKDWGNFLIQEGTDDLAYFTRWMFESNAAFANDQKNQLGLLSHWIATQLGMTTATETGVAARTAAEETGDAEQSAGWLANALKFIATEAGKVFAGVFGFLSDEMGPAAAGPAAGAAAGMTAVSIGLMSAAGGFDIPDHLNPIVQAHGGEMVLPANLSNGIKSLIANGGDQQAAGTTIVYSPQVSSFNTQNLAAYLNDPTVIRAFAVRLKNYLNIK